MNSDSDSGDDINLVNLGTNQQVNLGTNQQVNLGTNRYYQIQHKSDDKFVFKYMGTYHDEPLISLGNFNADGKAFYLESNLICKLEGNQQVNLETNLYPVMSVYVNDNGRLIKVQTGIEIKDKVSIDNADIEYTGTSYIELIDEERNYREVIKRDLIFPGSTKIVYFLIRELSNEKIIGYINGKRD